MVMHCSSVSTSIAALLALAALPAPAFGHGEPICNGGDISCEGGTIVQLPTVQDTFVGMSSPSDVSLAVPKYDGSQGALAGVEVKFEFEIEGDVSYTNNTVKTCSGHSWMQATVIDPIASMGAPLCPDFPYDVPPLIRTGLFPDTPPGGTSMVMIPPDGYCDTCALGPPIEAGPFVDPANLTAFTGLGDVEFTTRYQVSTTCLDQCNPGNCSFSHQFTARLEVTYYVCVPDENLPPVCIIDAPGEVECTGDVTIVPLDASQSFDPEGEPLDFEWGTDCPNAMFDDPHSATPNLLIDTSGGCEFSCQAGVRIDDGRHVVGCRVTITFNDGENLPPVCVLIGPETIECEGDLTMVQYDGSASFDPEGEALEYTWLTDCPNAMFDDPHSATPVLIFDTSYEEPYMCRVRLVVDDGRTEVPCRIIVTVQPCVAGQPGLDLKPTSGPNPLNTGSNGVIPVGLLGTGGFDVLDVDTSTVRLRRTDGVGGEVAPTQIQVSDVGTPFAGDPCECHTLGGDGIADLNLKFDKQEVVATLELDDVPDGTFLEVHIVGLTLGGVPFESDGDCFRIQ